MPPSRGRCVPTLPGVCDPSSFLKGNQMLRPIPSRGIENGPCSVSAEELAVTLREQQDWATLIADGELPLLTAELASLPELLPAICARRRSRFLRFLGTAIAADVLASSRRR